jgi:cell division protein FtsZ
MENPHSPAVALNTSIPDRQTSMKIVGVGGAGSNGVDRLKMEDLGQVPLAAINTDAQALASSPIEEKCMIGKGVTRGLGTGGDPELGRAAAEADLDGIHRIVAGTDLIFLLAGMGGGTGSGAAPVVAKTASEAGALVIAFVTLPFTFEGPRRQKQAEEGLALLRKSCDAVIPLPNDILLQQLDEGASVLDAFEKADEWVARGVKSIWAILSRTGLINLDFATLRQVFCNRGGKTLFGLGCGEGENWVQKSLNDLMLCPLLHTPEFSRKADRLLVNIVGGPDLGISHVNEIMGVVNDHFGREAHVAMGAVIDEAMAGRLEICVLGTTDVSGRPGILPRKAAPASRPVPYESAPLTAARLVSPVPLSRPAPPAPSPVASAAAASAEASRNGPGAASGRTQQEEFLFGEAEKRGYFDRTDDNVFRGEDLDVPTYLRRGVRVSLQ